MNNTVSFLIILEFVAPFAIVSIILLLMLLKGSKKNKQGLNQLLEGVQNSEESYRESLIEFLKKTGFEDKELEEAVLLFTKNRRAFFKLLLTSLTQNDADLMQGVGAKFTDIINHYHKLSIQSTPVEAEDEIEEEQVAQDDSEIKVFKRENKRLKAEVHVSVSALNSLFKEYASMFGEIPDKNQDMSVQQILEAMEKFTKGEFKPDNITSDLPPEMQNETENAPSDPLTTEQSSGDDDEAEIEVSDDEPVAEEKVVSEDDASNEPNWDEAFEEVETAGKSSSDDSAEPAAVESAENELAAEETEPSWDEAFEESGDAVEKVDENTEVAQAQQNSAKSSDESAPAAASENTNEAEKDKKPLEKGSET